MFSQTAKNATTLVKRAALIAKSKRTSRRVRGAEHVARATSDAPDRAPEPATGPEDNRIPFIRDSEEEDPLQMEPFPVVAVGASAGGLEAFTRLLQHLPADTGMAFVFVQHLSPQHPSMLASLLSRTTAMPVMEVQHGTRVQPDHVYIIPPNTLMSIADEVLDLKPRPEERSAPRPIDYFFRSLAVDQKGIAIGVVLSGADSDGALGLQAIRGAENQVVNVSPERQARFFARVETGFQVLKPVREMCISNLSSLSRSALDRAGGQY